MSSDINVQTFSGKVNVTNNLLVGQGHLFVDTTNNRVGINQSNPQSNLHLMGNAYISSDLQVDGILSGDGAGLTNLSTDSGSWVNGTNSNVHLAVSTDKVGIGVENPQTSLEIVKAGDPTLRIRDSDIDGKARIQLLETGGYTDGIPRYGNEISYDGDNNKFHISTYDGSTTKRDDLTIVRSTGNLGVGTTSPEQKLEVHGNILLGQNNVESFIHGGSTTAFSSDTDILIVADANDTSGATNPNSIIFGAGSAVNTDSNRDFTYAEAYPNDVPRVELMRITAESIAGEAGRLGLGTATPEEKIHFHANHEYIYQRFSTTAAGTTDKFDIACWNSTRSNGDHGVMFVNRANTDMRFINNSTEWMRIKNDGKVGINTNSPDEALHVNGNVLVTGNSRFEIDTSDTNHVIVGNDYSSLDSLSLISMGSININMDSNDNDTGKVIDFRESTKTDGGTLLMRIKQAGGVLIGDRDPYGSVGETDAQLALGGTHNAGYNRGNYVKLLISGGNNDGSSPYYIYCEDENGHDQFYVKGATSEGGRNGVLFTGGTILTKGFLQISHGDALGTTRNTRLKQDYRWSLSALYNHGLASGASSMTEGSDQDHWSIWESDVDSEGSSIAINGDTIVMISPSDQNSINYYDEDSRSRLWYIQTNGSITAQSDARLKTDISDILFGSDENEELNKYKKLRIISYKQKKPEHVTRITTKYDKIYYGVIAQEVLELYPECVDIPDDGGYYSVNYNLFNLITIKVLQTEIKKRETLRADLTTTKTQLDEERALNEITRADLEIAKADLEATKADNQKLEARIAFLESTLIS